MKYKNIEIIEYKEGYSYPIKENYIIDSDSNYNQSLLERDIDKLWVKHRDNSEIMKYIIIGGVILLAIFIVLQFFKKGG